MRDYVHVGSSPCEEDCVQVGADNYYGLSMKECKRFIELIRKTLGPEPEGAKLVVKSFPHDFGAYHEVVCWYDDNFPDSVQYAYRCEAEAPARWE